jgi:hypothetical protein
MEKAIFFWSIVHRQKCYIVIQFSNSAIGNFAAGGYSHHPDEREWLKGKVFRGALLVNQGARADICGMVKTPATNKFIIHNSKLFNNA